MLRSSSRPSKALITYTLLAICSVGAHSAGAQGLTDRLRGLLGGQSEAADESEELSENEIGNGLKEALQVAVGRVVEQLGAANGFNGDPAIRIPLPSSLSSVQSALGRIGLSSMLDDLEGRMNLAAEAAMPQARALFMQAIDDMTLEDVMNIYRGPDDAATRYFHSRMAEPLAAGMRPVVDESLADAGAVQALDRVMARYDTLPFVRDVDTDLTGYVVEKGIDGVFHYLAQEEAAIRRDPVARTTELLQRVFGN